tara:strand:+ start:430 stop:831 length:402 start_codon:yes stop_codon:yes gene_type:complete
LHNEYWNCYTVNVPTEAVGIWSKYIELGDRLKKYKKTGGLSKSFEATKAGFMTIYFVEVIEVTPMNIKIKFDFDKHGIKKEYWISTSDFTRYKKDDQGVSYIVIHRQYGQRMFWGYAEGGAWLYPSEWGVIGF